MERRSAGCAARCSGDRRGTKPERRAPGAQPSQRICGGAKRKITPPPNQSTCFFASILWISTGRDSTAADMSAKHVSPPVGGLVTQYSTEPVGIGVRKS
eukprot:scaffold2882_cov434-Prasinococcus_capsulatus_cf.AAC.7